VTTDSDPSRVPGAGRGARRAEKVRRQAERNAAALETSDLMHGLGARTARGGLIALSGQVLTMLIQLLSLVIMSRLLRPEDFGLVAMATAVTAFASAFVDLGLTTATIQRQTVSQQFVSALFYINLAVGILVMFVVIAAAPIAADVLNDERLLLVIIALSLNMPITAAGAQHMALLTRRMQYLHLRWTGLAAQLTGLVIGVMLAWFTDAGYWALVVGGWVQAAGQSLLYWVVSPWRPTWTREWRQAKDGLIFGLHLTGANILFWLSRQLDTMLIGGRWGAGEVGQYSRAFSLYLLPVNLITGPLRTAIVPALSRLQDKPEQWRRSLLEIQGALGLGTGLLTALLVSAPDLIVAVILGPQWGEAVEILQVLAFSIPLMVLGNTNSFIMTSLGRADRMLRWNLARVIVTVAALLVGLPYGGIGVAYAVTISSFVMVVPSVLYAAQGTPVSSGLLLRQAVSPWVCIGVAALTATAVRVETGSPLFDLVLKGMAAAAVYAIAAAMTLLYDKSFESLRQRLASRLRRGVLPNLEG
jgi:PST family polysaccharide transporter